MMQSSITTSLCSRELLSQHISALESFYHNFSLLQRASITTYLCSRELLSHLSLLQRVSITANLFSRELLSSLSLLQRMSITAYLCSRELQSCTSILESFYHSVSQFQRASIRVPLLQRASITSQLQRGLSQRISALEREHLSQRLSSIEIFYHNSTSDNKFTLPPPVDLPTMHWETLQAPQDWCREEMASHR